LENKNKLDSIAKMIELKNLNKKSNPKDSSGTQIGTYENKGENTYNPYEESSQSLSFLKKEDTSDLDRTRKILFELSDLMTNFSMKVHEHHEMTQQSIHKFKFVLNF